MRMFRCSYPVRRGLFVRVLLAALAAVGGAPARSEGDRVLMAGTPYATRYYVKEGAQPGPTLVVVGGVHGDEPAGYLAARKLLDWEVVRGKVVVLPDAHKEAIRRKMRGYPGNMNRMFPGKADGTPMERLAFEIFGMIRDSRPDVLLTLHESRDFHADDPSRYGHTLCYDFPALKPFMQRILERVNPDISPKKHRLLHFIDPFPTCPTYQAFVQLGIPATSVETSKTLPLDLRVRYQLMTVAAVMDEMGIRYRQGDIRPLATATLQGSEIPRFRPLVAARKPGPARPPRETQVGLAQNGKVAAPPSAGVIPLPPPVRAELDAPPPSPSPSVEDESGSAMGRVMQGIGGGIMGLSALGLIGWSLRQKNGGAGRRPRRRPSKKARP